MASQTILPLGLKQHYFDHLVRVSG